LLVGLLFSAWASWKISQQVELEARSSFTLRVYELQSSLAMQFQRYEDILFGVAGLYRADHEVSPAEFEAYAAALNISRRYKALSSFNYAEYFDESQRTQFAEAYEQAIGSVENIPLILAPDRDEHMVITRTAPKGAPGLGFDLMSTSHRIPKHINFPISAGLFRRNIPVSSGLPIKERGGIHPALAMRLGVFKSDGVSAPRLMGTVGLTFRIADFFEEALPLIVDSRMTYRVENIGRTDGTVYQPPVAIYTNHEKEDPLAGNRGAENIFKASFIQPFGGALLRVELSEDKASFIGNRANALPFFVFATGLLFFGLSATVIRILLSRKIKLKTDIKLKTEQLEREVLRAKRLERELADTVEEERRRIGYELHDEIGQRLTGMSLGFQALSKQLQSVSSDLSDQAAALEANTSEAIASVRKLTHGLIPVPHGPTGLRTALEQLAATACTNATQCIFDFDDPVDVNDENVAANLYRIAQEATNNALKHARAKKIIIRLDYEEGKVTLTVTDDGIGFQCDDYGLMWTHSSAGAGLRIMTHRASVINFSLQVESYRRRGTTIKVQEC